MEKMGVNVTIVTILRRFFKGHKAGSVQEET